MKLPSFLIFLLLFTTHISNAQISLPLHKTLQWSGYTPSQVRAGGNDSILFSIQGNAIAAINFLTGEQQVYYQADTLLLAFDINEHKKIIIVTDAKNQLVLYNYEKKQVLHRVPVDFQAADQELRISPGAGKVLLTQRSRRPHFSTDSTLSLSLYSLDSLQQMHIPALDFRIYAAEFYAEDNLLLSVSDNVSYKTSIQSLNLNGDSVYTVSSGIFRHNFRVNANLRVIVNFSDYYSGQQVMMRQDTTSLWENKMIPYNSLFPYSPYGFTISQVNEQYIIQNEGDKLQLWNFESKMPLAQLEMEGGPVNNCRIICSNAGKWILCMSDSNDIRVYPYPGNFGKKRIAFSDIDIVPQRFGNGEIQELCYSPAIPALAFSDGSGTVFIYDLKIRSMVKEMNIPPYCNFTLHPGKKMIVYLDENSRLKKSSIYKDDKAELFRNTYVNNYALNNTGNLVAVTSLLDSTVKVANFDNTDKIQKTIFLPNHRYYRTGGIYFTASDGLIIQQSSTDTSRYFYCAPRSKRAVEFYQSQERYGSAIISPCGKLFLYYDNNYIRLFEPGKRSCRLISEINLRDSAAMQKIERAEDKTVLRFYKAYFTGDSTLLLQAGTGNIYRYNFFRQTFQWVDSIGMSLNLAYPDSGEYYFRVKAKNLLEVCKKSNDQKAYDIKNNFLRPFAAAFTDDRHIAVSSDSTLIMMDLTRLRVDTFITIEPSSSIYSSYTRFPARMIVDTAAGSIAYANKYDMLSITSQQRAVKRLYTDYNMIDNYCVMPEQKRWAAASPDYRTGAYRLDFYSLDDTLVSSPLHSLALRKQNLRNLLYDKQHERILAHLHEDSSDYIEIISLSAMKSTDMIPLGRSANCVTADATGNNLYYLQSFMLESRFVDILVHMNIATQVKDSIQLAGPGKLIVEDTVNQRLLIGCSNGYVMIYDKQRKTMVSAFNAHDAEILSMALNNQNRLITVGIGGAIRYWNLDQQISLIGTLYFTNRSDFIFINSSSYYMATREGVKAINFKIGNRICPVKQFDQYVNRPDIILREIDSVENRAIADMYARAISKRPQLMGLDTFPTLDIRNLPYVRITNEKDVPVVTDKNYFDIAFEVTDAVHKLSRMNIIVNSVPVYGIKGKDLSGLPDKKIKLKERIILSEGSNKIELVAYNDLKNASTHEICIINYTPPPDKKYNPKIYLISMNVNRYQDSTFNLKYAVNDGKRISEKIAALTAPGRLQLSSFYDSTVKKDALQKISALLATTNVDDKVILQLSGHGMTDTSKMEFYFCTYDMDFKNPAEKGITFNDIEDLMMNIPARNKLVLIDACHSGLLDKNKQYTFTTVKENTFSSGGRQYNTLYSGITEMPDTSDVVYLIGQGEPDINKESFELMQEVFWSSDINRDGIFLFSATAGNSYAIESGDVQNGIFTYYLVSRLNNEISVKEISRQVQEDVWLHSNKRQKPSMRLESMDIDWPVLK